MIVRHDNLKIENLKMKELILKWIIENNIVSYCKFTVILKT